MAISFVGSAANSSSPNTGTSVDVSAIDIQAGDLILVAAAVGDTANNGLAAPTEGGYSRVPGIAATLYANDVNDTNLDLYYKIADGTETAVSFAAVGGSNASNAAAVMVFRGVDTTTPFDTNANTATGISSSNADPPSHDWSGTAGVWTVIAASTGHTGGATATFTFPANYTTNAVQRAHNDTIDVLVWMGYRTNPADPENPAAFSAANIGTAADNGWAAATMSLNPAPTSRRAIVTWAELETPNAPRRAIVSFAEFETPNAPRRAIVSFAELETPNAPRRAVVTWAELEVPDAASTDRRAIVTWAELETPNAPRRAIVSFAEFETPNEPRRAVVSFAEFETPNAPRRAVVTWGEFEVPDAAGPNRRAIVTWAEFEVPGGAGGGRTKKRREFVLLPPDQPLAPDPSTPQPVEARAPSPEPRRAPPLRAPKAGEDELMALALLLEAELWDD